MGLFGFGKKNEEPMQAPATGSVQLNTAKVTGNEVTPTGGLLNLKKNDFLNLTKAAQTLSNIRVSAGWDVVDRGSDYDLDIAAYQLDGRGRLLRHDGTIYFSNKHANGIRLDHDNLTGEGDGDDENMFFNFDKVSPETAKVAIYVVIYMGNSRSQTFDKVKNAYVRLVDQSVRPEKEICRYSLSEDGGRNTAVHFADLIRTDEGWTFKAVGEGSRDSIGSIEDKYEKGDI